MRKMKTVTASIVRTIKGALDLKSLPYSIGVTKSKGRGLYATRFIEKGTRIIRAPVIHFNKEDTDKISATVLEHYIFAGFSDDDESWIPLGHALLMNHSLNANVDCKGCA
jgi:SET domain-containing protein